MHGHKSESELQADIAAAEQSIVIGATYEHYKDPSKLYKVLDLIISEASDAPEVVYQALYGIQLKFGRLASSWLETVEVDGEMVPRYTLIETATDEFGGNQANGQTDTGVDVSTNVVES